VCVCYNIITYVYKCIYLFIITVVITLYAVAQWLNDGKHTDEISKGIVITTANVMIGSLEKS